MRILSEIVKTDLTATDKTTGISVGEGLAPPEFTVKLKPCGKIAKEQIQLIETRFSSVTIEDYVIMPDHIHVVIFLHEKAGGASPSPTVWGKYAVISPLILHALRDSLFCGYAVFS